MAHFAKYETDEKFKGLADYEWNTTQSRQDKAEERKRIAKQKEMRRKKQEEWEERQK